MVVGTLISDELLKNHFFVNRITDSIKREDRVE